MSSPKSFPTLEQAFIYYTDCQIATLYGYFDRKAQSWSSKKRQLNITAGMVSEIRGLPYPQEREPVLARWQRFLEEFSITLSKDEGK